ncbi:MAG: hypothetical protein ACLFTK_11320 [Anaerolineales bacterium]
MTSAFYLFFAGYDGHVEQIGLAYSTDGQGWRISPEPIIPLGVAGAWDAVQTSNPSVLYENGLFRMWYQGVDARNTYRIGYAESEDGWVWQKHPDKLFQRDDLAQLDPVPRREGYHQPLVLHDGERYRMYFSEHRNAIGYIRVATSQDGYAWALHPADCLAPELGWEARGLHYPWVIAENGGYTMWYTTEDTKHHWFLGRAVSADGFTWRREPPTEPVIDKRTTRRFSRYTHLIPRHLSKWYPNYRHPKVRSSPLKRASLSPPQGIIGRQVVTFYDRVVFPFRAQRFMSFNNSSVIRQDNETYLMYFQSRDENGTLSIGRCASPDGVDWGQAKTNILKPTIEREGIEWCSVFDADPHLLILETDAGP